MVSHIYKYTTGCHSQTTPSSEWREPLPRNVLAPSADKQTRNYHIECSNYHHSLSTLRPKGLSRSKMKWWAIHTNLPVDVIVRLRHPRSGKSQSQVCFLAPSADKQTGNYDIECSNHHPSLSTVRPIGLSRSNYIYVIIYINYIYIYNLSTISNLLD